MQYWSFQQDKRNRTQINVTSKRMKSVMFVTIKRFTQASEPERFLRHKH